MKKILLGILTLMCVVFGYASLSFLDINPIKSTPKTKQVAAADQEQLQTTNSKKSQAIEFYAETASAPDTVSDPVTQEDWQNCLSTTTENTGVVWVDKSVTKDSKSTIGALDYDEITVNKSAGAEFLADFSMLSSTVTETTYEPASLKPLNVVLVLDQSNSMKNVGSSETTDYGMMRLFDAYTATNYQTIIDNNLVPTKNLYLEVYSTHEKHKFTGMSAGGNYMFEGLSNGFGSTTKLITNGYRTNDNGDTTYILWTDYTVTTTKSKMELLNAATNDFVQQMENTGVSINVAVTGFGDTKITTSGGTYVQQNYNGTGLYNGNSFIRFDNISTTNYSNAFSDVSTPEGATKATSALSAVKVVTNAHTYIDKGLEMAYNIFKNNDTAGRQNIVLVLTDDAPGIPSSDASGIIYFISGREYGQMGDGNIVEQRALAQATKIKDDFNATIFSIGIFDGADSQYDTTGVTDATTNVTARSNRFLMRMASGNNGRFLSATADDLETIFEDLAEILTSITYEEGEPTEIQNGGDAGHSGYVTYTDPAGKYMEIKDINSVVLRNGNYSYTSTSESGNVKSYIYNQEVQTNMGTTANLSEMIVEVHKGKTLEAGDTLVVKVPAEIIPLRKFNVERKSTGETTMSVHRVRPLHVFYSIGLKNNVRTFLDDPENNTVLTTDEITAFDNYAALNSKNQKVMFYANDYTTGSENGNATVNFKPSTNNHFYYFINDTPLWTDDHAHATETDKADIDLNNYHVHIYHYDFNDPRLAGNQTPKSDTPYVAKLVEDTPDARYNCVINGIERITKDMLEWNSDGGYWYVPTGSNKTVHRHLLDSDKEQNATETATNSYYATYNTDGTVTVQLGNNGRLSVPYESVKCGFEITDTWSGEDASYCEGSNVSKTLNVETITLKTATEYTIQWQTSTDNGATWQNEGSPIASSATDKSFTYNNSNFDKTVKIRYLVNIDGCEPQTTGNEVTLTLLPRPVVEISDVTTDNIVCPSAGVQTIEGSVSVATTAPYDFTWTSDLTISYPDASNKAEISVTIPNECDKTYSVSLEAKDANNCVSEKVTKTFTVKNETNPEISCPADVTVDAAAGKSYAELTFDDPTYSGQCNPAYNIIYSPATPTNATTTNASGQYPIGETTVTYTVTDDCNKTATCSFKVTVEDKQKPEVVCKATTDQTKNADDNQNYYTNVGDGWDATATDNSGAVPTMKATLSGATTANELTTLANQKFNIGETTVIWTATDAAGNSSTCSFKVMVEDKQKPEVVCKATTDQTKSTDDNQNYYTNVGDGWDATATDNSGAVPTLKATLSGATTANELTTLANQKFNIGTTTVTWTATDAAGNSSTCSFKVTVEDNQKPEVGTVDDQILTATNCDYEYPDLTEMVRNVSNDNATAKADLTITQNPAAGTAITLSDAAQTLDVVVTVKDEADNSSEIAVKVIVPAELKFNVTETSARCENKNDDGFIKYSIAGGTANYEVTLAAGTAAETKTSAGEYSFENLEDGDYTLTVKDAHGCTVSQNAKVEVGDEYYITIATQEKSWTYDGTEHSHPYFDLTVGQSSSSENYNDQISGTTVTLDNGDKITVILNEDKIKDAGEKDNSIKEYSFLRGTDDVTCYYKVTETENKLTVTLNTTDVTLTCPNSSSATLSKQYDGSKLTASASASTTISGDVIDIEYSLDNTTWTADVPSIGPDVTSETSVYVRTNNDNYETQTCQYTLEITKAQVTLKSQTFEREYDGLALTNNDAALESETGWVGDEGASYTFTGTQTLVGSSKNAFSYTLKEGTKASNYEISKNEGDLIITDRTEKFEIEVIAESKETTYNGQTQSVSGFELEKKTINGIEFTVSGLEAFANGKDAAEYPTTITGTPIVKDADGNDVTDQFTVKQTNGKLIINKADVSLRSATLHKTFDDEPLTNGSQPLEIEAGWAPGEGAIYTFTGSRTYVGGAHEEENTFTCEAKPGTNFDNYNIKVEYGDLIVEHVGEKFKLNVKAITKEVTYNAETQSADGFLTTTFNVNGHNYTVTGLSAHAEGRDAGTYANIVTGTATVFDQSGNDVTDEFDVVTFDGELVIKKAKLVITGEKEKEHDGDKLSMSYSELTYDKLLGTDKITSGKIETESADEGVYTCTDGNFNYMFAGGNAVQSGFGPASVTKNYDVTFNVTLTITEETKICEGTEYEGYFYEAIKIGKQCWLKENLKVEKGNHKAYGENAENVNKFGYLYSWYTAIGIDENDDTTQPAKLVDDDGNDYVQGVCPPNWAVPSKEDFEILNNYAQDAAYLKDMDTQYWIPEKSGIEPNLDFNARGAGRFNGTTNRFEELLTNAYFWTVDFSQSSITPASSEINYYCSSILQSQSSKYDLKSVRCIRKIFE